MSLSLFLWHNVRACNFTATFHTPPVDSANLSVHPPPLPSLGFLCPCSHKLLFISSWLCARHCTMCWGVIDEQSNAAWAVMEIHMERKELRTHSAWGGQGRLSEAGGDSWIWKAELELTNQTWWDYRWGVMGRRKAFPGGKMVDAGIRIIKGLVVSGNYI